MRLGVARSARIGILVSVGIVQQFFREVIAHFKAYTNVQCGLIIPVYAKETEVSKSGGLSLQ